MVQRLESACQCKGHSFNPWSRNIPQAMEQLNVVTTTEAQAHKQEATREVCTWQLESGPTQCSWRRPRVQQRKPTQPETNKQTVISGAFN